MPPPKLSLNTTTGIQPVSTIPDTGLNDIGESIPVVIARGVYPSQNYVDVPIYDGTLNTIVLVVPANPNRRYLKILNNGPSKIELWTGSKPLSTSPNKTILRGEVLAPYGGGLEEHGERISAIYASVAGSVPSGLFVLEG